MSSTKSLFSQQKRHFVVTAALRGHTQKIPLNEFLQPRHTSSSQGSIEELEAQLTACRESQGALLAKLVIKGILTFEEAMEISGQHPTYVTYRHGADIKLVEE